MTRLNVNPTRMELNKLRKRLTTAVRGHKLLKDKSDEMVRVFSELLKENKRLRDEVEGELARLQKNFAVARAVTPYYQAETAFSMSVSAVEAECGQKSILGIEVPQIEIKEGAPTCGLPYAYPEICGEADECVKLAEKLIPKMLKLACVEKTVRVMADEIERNKRRVNALEYVMIPQLEETVKYIRDKLDENDRAALVRLMKVKSK